MACFSAENLTKQRGWLKSWETQQGPAMERRLSTPCFAVAFSLLPLLFYATFSRQQQQDQILGETYTTCLRNASTALPASFSATLNRALGSFTHLSQQGLTFANTSSDGLYAMFQCRGDLSPPSCSTCMQNAAALLPLACPLSIGARIRLDGCFLRYDNQSFFHLDTTTIVTLCNTAKTTDPIVRTNISHVMQEATSQAPKSRNLFASATERAMYAMAECWRYLSQADCSQCLATYSSFLFCDSALGKQLHMASCEYRFEIYIFLEAAPSFPPSPGSSPPPPALTASSASSPGRWKTWLIVVIVVVALLTIIGAICIGLGWRRRRSKIKGVNKWVVSIQQSLSRAQLFSLEELEQATDHFHPSNKLGEGGFGAVYKGTLLNGEQVAIKKLRTESQRGKQDFLNEVNVITNVQHKNLIRLLGCCVEASERLLVYEYLANKSLDCFLSATSNRKLTWSNRFGIILGMAKGLGYLHEESQIRIIHRDIKPGNILLDDQLNPVIADFGLARLIRDNETYVNTAVAGTIGYLAPEYAVRGALSEKVDVYAFGLVALEVLTGMQNMPTELLASVWQAYQNGNVRDLADHNMGGIFSMDEFSRTVHVALLCTQENPKLRPVMSTVILWLSGLSNLLELPIKPTFLDYIDVASPMPDINHHVVSTSSTSSQSTNQINLVSGGVLSFSEIAEPR